MKKLPYFLFCIVLCNLSACRPQNNSSNQSGNTTRTASASTSPLLRTEIVGEPALGEATVNVYILQAGEGVSGASVEVTGDMTHAGMIPVISQAEEVEAGLYQTKDFSFTMAGDWFIISEVTLPSGETITEEIDVLVPNK